MKASLGIAEMSITARLVGVFVKKEEREDANALGAYRSNTIFPCPGVLAPNFVAADSNSFRRFLFSLGRQSSTTTFAPRREVAALTTHIARSSNPPPRSRASPSCISISTTRDRAGKRDADFISWALPCHQIRHRHSQARSETAPFAVVHY